MSLSLNGEENGLLPPGYSEFLAALKTHIRSVQVQAAVAFNQELVRLYWLIGRDIEARQQSEGWGANVINRLARDLKAAFPEMAGFSARNLYYMREFARSWPDESILQQAVAKLPWGHNLLLLAKLSNHDTRLWYARQAIVHGWSRSVLEMSMETRVGASTSKQLRQPPRAIPQRLRRDTHAVQHG